MHQQFSASVRLLLLPQAIYERCCLPVSQRRDDNAASPWPRAERGMSKTLPQLRIPTRYLTGSSDPERHAGDTGREKIQQFGSSLAEVPLLCAKPAYQYYQGLVLNNCAGLPCSLSLLASRCRIECQRPLACEAPVCLPCQLSRPRCQVPVEDASHAVCSRPDIYTIDNVAG